VETTSKRNTAIGKRLLVIVGATAVGKTDLSLHVARQYGGEVISADSRLFYRHMDIGTAKPPLAERATIPHHFIDIVNPDETVTLGWYQDECYRLIDQLHEQGKLPILVGGTGQYVKAVVEGWGIPRVAPQPGLRAELAQEDSYDLHVRLQKLDPIAAEKIHPNNKRRLIRALEVCMTTGEPISKLQEKRSPPYNILMVGLHRERKALYRRIDERVDLMMAAGLLDEMERLREMGYGRNLPSMSGIGYQQLWEYLDGEWTLPEAVERIKMETHRFVRHQNNWFGNDAATVWIDAAAQDFPASALAYVSEWINKL
jgi:tRNA dimethylallyltransferase